jgi:cytochrome c biogenesis protein CcmG/thiol:disulfide interchange protein DsbE
MKIYSVLFFLFTPFFAANGLAQEIINTKIPAVQIKTMEGNVFNTLAFSNNGKPIVIDFWATWCVPCIMELNAIADKYEYWQRETGVKVIIVSVDTVHNTTTVSSFIRNKGWRYDVYLDPDKDFQKAMHVMDTPCTFVIDGSGKIVWMHNSYMEGDEDKVFEELTKISATK